MVILPIPLVISIRPPQQPRRKTPAAEPDNRVRILSKVSGCLVDGAKRGLKQPRLQCICGYRWLRKMGAI